MLATFLQQNRLPLAPVDRVVNSPLFTVANTPVTLATLLVLAVVLVLTLWLSHLAQKTAARTLAHRSRVDPGAVAIISRLIGYGVVVVGLGVALATAGINLSALFAAGAFFAVAVGFAMQNVAQNFVSGIILLMERTIKPGDILEVQGQVVRVTGMGLRATVARTRDEEDLIIPNSILVQNTVTNFTLRDPSHRLRCTVGVSYRSDPTLVVQALNDACTRLSWRVPEPPPRILLTGFGNSSINFEVCVWSRDPWRSRVLQSELNHAIWAALADAGITIPFPQVDVHFDHPEAEPPGPPEPPEPAELPEPPEPADSAEPRAALSPTRMSSPDRPAARGRAPRRSGSARSPSTDAGT